MIFSSVTDIVSQAMSFSERSKRKQWSCPPSSKPMLKSHQHLCLQPTSLMTWLLVHVMMTPIGLGTMEQFGTSSIIRFKGLLAGRSLLISSGMQGLWHLWSFCGPLPWRWHAQCPLPCCHCLSWTDLLWWRVPQLWSCWVHCRSSWMLFGVGFVHWKARLQVISHSEAAQAPRTFFLNEPTDSWICKDLALLHSLGLKNVWWSLLQCTKRVDNQCDTKNFATRLTDSHGATGTVTCFKIINNWPNTSTTDLEIWFVVWEAVHKRIKIHSRIF